MSDAFKSIDQGLREALLHAKGEGASLVFQVDLSEKDVPKAGTRAAREDPRTQLAKPKASKSGTYVPHLLVHLAHHHGLDLGQKFGGNQRIDPKGLRHCQRFPHVPSSRRA